MTKRAVSTVIVLAAMLGACGGGTSSSVAAAPTVLPREVPVYVDACPLSHLRGLRAEVADVPGGVAVQFEGPERMIYLLRGNVRAMAAAGAGEGNPFAICPCRSLDTGGSVRAARARGSDLGATSMQAPSTTYFPPAAVTTNDTPTGATLVLTGTDDEEADLVRSAARQEVKAMGECLAGGRY